MLVNWKLLSELQYWNSVNLVTTDNFSTKDNFPLVQMVPPTPKFFHIGFAGKSKKFNFTIAKSFFTEKIIHFVPVVDWKIFPEKHHCTYSCEFYDEIQIKTVASGVIRRNTKLSEKMDISPKCGVYREVKSLSKTSGNTPNKTWQSASDIGVRRLYFSPGWVKCDKLWLFLIWKSRKIFWRGNFKRVRGIMEKREISELPPSYTEVMQTSTTVTSQPVPSKIIFLFEIEISVGIS